MLEAPFANDEEQFVFQLVRKFDTPKLQAAAPSCHFLLFHGKHDFAEFINFLIAVFIGLTTFEAVQFFVIVIFDLFADGSQQTFLLADLMLSAAFTVYIHHGRSFLQFAAVYLFLNVPVVEISGYQSEQSYSHQC